VSICAHDLALPHCGDATNKSPDSDGSLAELEKKEIIKVMKQFNGHRSKVSQYLGINRKTLREKIRKYNIDL
jgi:DNA-binding protein Fis